MKKFDTKVQYLKYKVLREIARLEWEGNLITKILEIPETIVNGSEAKMRCCVYKERAIIAERIKLAMGGNSSNPNIIEVINIACDECPMGGFEVTGACRGCLAHRCEDVCKKGAIYFDKNHTAIIDKSKCIECGLCTKVCPYNAIIKNKRPCEHACKVNAIYMDENYLAKIDNDKCISCGACVYQCPWGAIMDKSFILNVIDTLKKSQNNSVYNVYAVVAPSISSQFSYTKTSQVISAIEELGFFKVVEAALGADMVANKECLELYEKKFLTSSCCPAFVDYVEKSFPDLKEFVSHNLSPMAEISKYIKSEDPTAKVVFIGPCTAKKMEFLKPEVKKYVDCVLTFEELQALFDSKNIDINSLPEKNLNSASFYGRIFARSGGLSEAIEEGFKENGFEDFQLKALPCDGIEACKIALTKKSKNLLLENFIEGMACVDGCIGGAGCLTHGVKNKKQVDNYGKEAKETTIKDAIEKSRI